MGLLSSIQLPHLNSVINFGKAKLHDFKCMVNSKSFPQKLTVRMKIFSVRGVFWIYVFNINVITTCRMQILTYVPLHPIETFSSLHIY